MSVVNKDIPTKVKQYGQFLTPPDVADFCMSKVEIKADTIIEPSCGAGVFLDRIRARTSGEIIAVELDPEVIKQYTGSEQIQLGNFYDFDRRFDRPVQIIGNPPYKCPAYSLSTHRDKILAFRKKHDLPGMREEAVFFLLKCLELSDKVFIDFILPKAIFKNNSKAFKKFIVFLERELRLVSCHDIDGEFEGVARNLVFASFESGGGTSEYFKEPDDFIDFRKIFKKTYLGSVPCESIFLSVRDEPKDHFRDRLIRLFSGEDFYESLCFNGEPHLRAVKSKNQKKLEVLKSYLAEAQTLITRTDLENYDNYKPITHREESRWYFRHDNLKRASFVYQINSNPCPSFYFPGNPSSSSKDYFGFCDYDINRNSGPGANRTVPIEGLEDNLQPEFKTYWLENTSLPFDRLFDYILHIANSSWYANMKRRFERFYFAIPKQFDKSWLCAL